jgi:4-oxalocrotonate tautomerase
MTDTKTQGDRMPYVNVRITREGATPRQKAEIIRRMTDVLVEVLDKDPQATFIVIDEVALEDWGLAGRQVSEIRRG